MITKKIPLSTLAKRINRRHNNAISHVGRAIELARTIGEDLLTVKKQVGHGNWEKWVTKNCTFAPRQARKYMAIATAWERVSKSAPSSDLTINQASTIASKSAPLIDMAVATMMLSGELELDTAVRKVKSQYVPLTDELCDQINEREGRFAITNSLEKLQEHVNGDSLPKHNAPSTENDDAAGVATIPMSSTKGRRKAKSPAAWSLHDALEYLNETMEDIESRWPAEYREVLGRKLIAMGECIVELLPEKPAAQAQ